MCNVQVVREPHACEQWIAIEEGKDEKWASTTFSLSIYTVARQMPVQ